MKELTHKLAQFFSGEDFAERGDDARLELTPAELRQISCLMTENAKLKAKLKSLTQQSDCEECCNGVQTEKAKLCQKSYLAGYEHGAKESLKNVAKIYADKKTTDALKGDDDAFLEAIRDCSKHPDSLSERSCDV